MNKRFITLQMLGISLATFSQLTCATPEEQSGIDKKISTLSAPAISTAAISADERQNIIDRLSHNIDEGRKFGKGNKFYVIRALEKVPAEHLQAFEEAVNRLSQGMDGFGKVQVIEVVEQTPAERLTPAFEEAVNRLSQGMDGSEKAEVIIALAKVPAKCLEAFEAAVNRLSQGMDGSNKAEVMIALAKVPTEHLEAFEAAVNRLSQVMFGSDKAKAMRALAEVPAECLEAFEAAVNCLSQGLRDSSQKSSVIRAVATVPAERLTTLVNAFTPKILQELDRAPDDDRANLISRLAGMEPAAYRAEITRTINKCLRFQAAVHRLSQGMSFIHYYPQSEIIRDIAAVPAECLEAFVAAVNCLSQGLRDSSQKFSVIRAVATVPVKRLTTLMNAFTPQILRELYRAPDHDKVNLINRLATMQPGQWQAEITQTINQYRHNNVVTQPSAAFEVHNYANMQVTPSSGAGSSSSGSGSSSASSSSPSRSPSLMRLDDAVMQNMNQRLQTANVPSMDYPRAKALLEERIERKYSNSSASSSERERAKHAALAKLASDTNYEQVISTAVSFLQQFHHESIGLWLDGFLTESMNAYGNNGESCSKGIQERVATGMRNIDPELDKLFAQAEGPALVNKFIGNLNLSDKKRCEAITKELIKLGLNTNSTAAEAGEIFERYIRDWFTESGVSADKYLSDIQTMKELVVENGFETYIQPIVKKSVDEADRALRAAQDQATSAGSSSSSASSLFSAVSLNSGSGAPQALGAVSPGAAAPVAAAPARLSKEEERAARIKAIERQAGR